MLGSLCRFNLAKDKLGAGRFRRALNLGRSTSCFVGGGRIWRSAIPSGQSSHIIVISPASRGNWGSRSGCGSHRWMARPKWATTRAAEDR